MAVGNTIKDTLTRVIYIPYYKTDIKFRVVLIC